MLCRHTLLLTCNCCETIIRECCLERKFVTIFFYNNSPWEKESITNMIVEGESLSFGKIEVYLIVRTCDGFASFH